MGATGCPEGGTNVGLVVGAGSRRFGKEVSGAGGTSCDVGGDWVVVVSAGIVDVVGWVVGVVGTGVVVISEPGGIS